MNSYLRVVLEISGLPVGLSGFVCRFVWVCLWVCLWVFLWVCLWVGPWVCKLVGPWVYLWDVPVVGSWVGLWVYLWVHSWVCFGFICGFGYGFGCGFVCGFFCRFIYGFICRFIYWFILGSICGFVCGFICGLVRRVICGFNCGLVCKLVCVFFCGFICGFVYEVFCGFICCLVCGFICGFVCGICCGFICGFVCGLDRGLIITTSNTQNIIFLFHNFKGPTVFFIPSSSWGRRIWEDRDDPPDPAPRRRSPRDRTWEKLRRRTGPSRTFDLKSVLLLETNLNMVYLSLSTKQPNLVRQVLVEWQLKSLKSCFVVNYEYHHLYSRNRSRNFQCPARHHFTTFGSQSHLFYSYLSNIEEDIVVFPALKIRKELSERLHFKNINF